MRIFDLIVQLINIADTEGNLPVEWDDLTGPIDVNSVAVRESVYDDHKFVMFVK